MTYTMQFECVGGLVKTASGAERPRDFIFWEPVMRRFAAKCDEFSIYCRLTDREALESGARMGAREIAQLEITGRTEVWSGRLDDYFAYELIKQPFDEEGKIKWYSLFLKQQGRTILSALKYGREYGIHQASREDVDAVSEMLNAEMFSFCFWEEAGNGQEIDVESLLRPDDELAGIVRQFGGRIRTER